MRTEVCPSCKASAIIVDGRLSAVEARLGDVRVGLHFHPAHARHAEEGRGVGLGESFHACTACGHVWGRLDAGKLLEWLSDGLTPLAAQHLICLEQGPAHDLPDSAEASAAGGRVTEIDALVLRGNQAEATRRYRELMTCTWDDAIDAVRRWAELDRPEKLARVGWRSKEKTRSEGHPMSDRELDG